MNYDITDITESEESCVDTRSEADENEVFEEDDAVYDDIPDEEEKLSSPQTDRVMTALTAEPTDRSWRETEIVDEVRYPEYDRQKSFILDAETGEVMEAPYGTKGSQRPDGIMFLDDGSADIREDKNYLRCDALIRNIEQQTESRRKMFGENVRLTFVIAPKFTLEEADRISRRCVELGVEIDWQLK